MLAWMIEVSMASGTKNADQSHFYVWQAPGGVFTIQLSLEVVEKLTREQMRVEGNPSRNLNGFLVGRSVASPNPALFVEDFVLVPAGAAGKNETSSAHNDALTEKVWELVRGGGRHIIGYFRSQREGALIPIARDLIHAGRLSTEPVAVLLLVRFPPHGQSEGAFFYWESGATESSESGLFPFEVAKLSPTSRVVKAAELWPIQPEPAPPPANVERPKQPVFWLRLSPTILLFTVATLVTQLLSRPSPSSGSEQTTPVETVLGLKVTSRPHQLEIHWKENSPQILAAEKATMKISEGNATEVINLDQSDLREGYVTYATSTRDVSVRFEVRGPGGSITTESVRAFTSR